MGAKRPIALAAAVAFAPVLAAAPAMAGPSPHMMVGSWSGRAQAPDVGDSQAVSLQVDSQDHRRFTGEFRFVDNPDIIPVDGTVSESGQVSIVGKGDGVHLVITGDLTESDIDPCIFEGRFQFQMGGGAPQAGSITLTHDEAPR